MEKKVREYLNNIKKDVKREDCLYLTKIIEEESGCKARMQGRIVAFGDKFLIGFCLVPRIFQFISSVTRP